MRLVRWRIRLVMFSVAEILIAQLIVFVVLPQYARVFSFEVLCVAIVFIGALPVAASLMQYAIVGFHTWRVKYRQLKPYYPRVAVIVPAWNEEAVIGNTLDHLFAMEYPADRLRVIVVDDASVDRTSEIARAKAAAYPDRVIVMRRAESGRGKAHTLNFGLDRVLADDWAEAVLVMDADVLFEPSALRKMTRHLSDPRVGAVTAYIKEGTHDGNYLTRFIAFEYITAQAVGRRAQNVLGVLGCLAGGAQLHSRENIEAIGGRIDTSSLAEDTITTFRTQLAGRRVEFEGNAIVWAEEPSDIAGLWRQRMRWARGNLQASLQFVSIWGKQRSTFGNLARTPFLLLWFTVLLMPITMFTSSVALLALFALHSGMAWAVLRLLWIWAAIAYGSSIALALAIDWRTARACWREAIMFPGAVALAIMLYSVHPALFEVNAVQWLARAGIVVTPLAKTMLSVGMYSWLIVCVPIAYLARTCAETPRLRWLVPALVYLVGYGPFLCAVTFGSYVLELMNAGSKWEKTTKVGRVMLSAGGQR